MSLQDHSPTVALPPGDDLVPDQWPGCLRSAGCREASEPRALLHLQDVVEPVILAVPPAIRVQSELAALALFRRRPDAETLPLLRLLRERVLTAYGAGATLPYSVVHAAMWSRVHPSLPPSTTQEDSTMSATASEPVRMPAVSAKRRKPETPEQQRERIIAKAAAEADKLTTRPQRGAWVARMAVAERRPATTLYTWLRLGLDRAGKAKEERRKIQPDLLEQPQQAPAAVAVAVEELPQGKLPPEKRNPITLSLVRFLDGIHALEAVALPLEAAPGDRASWWDMQRLSNAFGPAFDLSQCQVPGEAVDIWPVAGAHGVYPQRLLRADAVLLVLACNKVHPGAAHLFAMAVEREYQERFAPVPAAAESGPDVPTLALPGGGEVALILGNENCLVRVAPIWEAFLPHVPVPPEGLGEFMTPSALLAFMVANVAKADVEDRAFIAELISWLCITAVPACHAIDTAAQR